MTGVQTCALPISMPRQDARCGHLHFAFVNGPDSELAGCLFQYPRELGLVAVHKFHHGSGSDRRAECAGLAMYYYFILEVDVVRAECVLMCVDMYHETVVSVSTPG